MASGIYKITNTVNGKFYIGSAVNLAIRKYKHLNCLRKGNHRNSKLQAAFNKYGNDAFEWETIEIVEDPSLLIGREQHYFDTLNPFYNICRIAGSSLGVRHSENTKKALSERRKGVPLSEETKRRMSESKKGIPKSAEWKRQAREIAKKENLSAETLIKRSLALKGRVFSSEWKKKISDGKKRQFAIKLEQQPNLFSGCE